MLVLVIVFALTVLPTTKPEFERLTRHSQGVEFSFYKQYAQRSEGQDSRWSLISDHKASVGEDILGISVALPNVIETVMEVKPITPNPKVRQLTYAIEVRFDLLFLFYANYYGIAPEVIPLQKRDKHLSYYAEKIELFCYDFNDQYSTQLSTFFNPHQKDQQLKLEAMLKEYLNTEDRLFDYGLEMVRLKWFDIT